jgi:hypothetical protein
MAFPAAIAPVAASWARRHHALAQVDVRCFTAAAFEED